jgi:hypothetical protein
VRPALAAFYDSLNKEPKRRLEAIGGAENHSKKAENSAGEDLASACQRQTARFTKPLQHIGAMIQPTEQQTAAIDDLKQASTKAADELLASCPPRIAETPVARLDAVNKRLEATVRGIQPIRPALVSLYDTLSDEQKARFDTGRVPAQSGGRAKVGTLQCNLASTVGLIVASRQRLSCTFTPDGPGRTESYFGHLTTVGLDIGVGGGRMI